MFKRAPFTSAAPGRSSPAQPSRRTLARLQEPAALNAHPVSGWCGAVSALPIGRAGELREAAR